VEPSIKTPDRPRPSSSPGITSNISQEALDLAADWADISQGLRKDLGQQLHSQWIKPIQLGSRSARKPARSTCSCPPNFPPTGCADRFADRLSLAWKIARPEVRQVRITVHPRAVFARIALRWRNRRAAAHGIAHDRPNGRFGRWLSDRRSSGLDPSLTFTNSCPARPTCWPCNAAQRMAATETPQFSPLYLKAATGQGKTHLLHAIGHAYLPPTAGARIFYCSAERFMVEFVQALRQNQMIEFKITAARV
jgi:chromosomal replication initiator protein